MLYVGVDAHKATSHITVMDGAGKILKRKRVPSTLMGLADALGGFPEPMKAVLEASYNWGPMYDWLGEFADEVTLAHPARVKAIAHARIKTDKIDSETLAHLLRTDLIPPAYAPSKEIRAIKRVLRQRMFFVRVRTMTKNRIHALLAQHAVPRPKVSDLFGVAGRRWLQSLTLPEPDGTLLADDLEFLEVVGARIKTTEALIAQLAKHDPLVAVLKTLPGIGEFFAVLIRYEVDDMRRFHSPGQFASYVGLVPSTYASGDRTIHGHLTKLGNHWLRWAFVEAVQPATQVSPSLRRFAERLRARRGRKAARTAVARKLAELSWYVWIEQRCYQER